MAATPILGYAAIAVFVAPSYAVVKEVVEDEGTYYNVVAYTEVFDGTDDVTLLSDMVADGTIVLQGC